MTEPHAKSRMKGCKIGRGCSDPCAIVTDGVDHYCIDHGRERFLRSLGIFVGTALAQCAGRTCQQLTSLRFAMPTYRQDLFEKTPFLCLDCAFREFLLMRDFYQRRAMAEAHSSASLPGALGSNPS